MSPRPPHNYKDMTGEKIGRWTVLEKSGITDNNTVKWLCRCVCGTERIVGGEKLRQGKSMSCGCGNAEDMTGSVYGCWSPQDLKRKLLEKTLVKMVWAVVRPKNIKNVDGPRVVVAWCHMYDDAVEFAQSVNVPGTEIVRTDIHLVTNTNDELDARVFLTGEEADEYIERADKRLEWRCVCEDCGATRYLTRGQLKKKTPPKCHCDPDYGNTYSLPLMGTTIGTWEVIRRYGTNEYRLALWECRCLECGDIRVLTSSSIKGGAKCTNEKCAHREKTTP